MSIRKMSSVHIDVKRIEFVVINACGGKCKHCSVAESEKKSGSVDVAATVNLISRVTSKYAVESVMTFGGEPLLYPEVTCAIHATARGCGIPARQIITNGFFSHDNKKIESVASEICASGVNDVLLSVDAFHQATALRLAGYARGL